MAAYRRYSVRAGLSGQVIVDVPLGALQLRSEAAAVTQYAWLKLMGKNELGEDVNKNLDTRYILNEEMLSRYEHQRGSVYDQFASKIRFKPICNIER
jgi:hypothetical protein